MNVELIPLQEQNIIQFKKDMQTAFQLGAEGQDCGCDEVLPEEDINQSLETKGAIAYQAMLNGDMVGGAIVVIDPETQHNHLHFLYVKHGVQSRGIGQQIWKSIEKKHPETKVWETCTPYFEKRNIHFYINRCGFHAVEFFNKHHSDPNIPESIPGGEMFRFEKVMKPTQ